MKTLLAIVLTVAAFTCSNNTVVHAGGGGGGIDLRTGITPIAQLRPASSQTNSTRHASGTLQPGLYRFDVGEVWNGASVTESASTAGLRFDFRMSSSVAIHTSSAARSVRAETTTTDSFLGTGDWSGNAAANTLDRGGAVVHQDTNIQEQAGASGECWVTGTGTGSGQCSLSWNFGVLVPTDYSIDVEFFREPPSFSTPPGQSQTNPTLPSGGSPAGWIIDARAGQWIDPPTTYGFDYSMLSESLFTEILDFPIGFAEQFQVYAGGSLVGAFGPGQSVSFTQFPGGGVPSFQIVGISPLVDERDPTAFPVRLTYSTPVATLRMTPIPSPPEHEVPLLACAGFDHPLAEGAVKVRRGRVLPHKAVLQRADGSAVRPGDIFASPMIRIAYSPVGSSTAVDVSDLAETSGGATSGSAFVFDDQEGVWRYNLQVRNYSARGTYDTTIVSGDQSEYLIVAACRAQFVIE